MKVLWWHWVILGFSLIGLELVIPSFTIIWFGLGGLFVAMLMLIFPGMPIWFQLLLWAIASVAFTVMWFKYLRPRKDQTHSGLSKEPILGETGIVIRGTKDSYSKGVVRFRIAILGADEWPCYSDETLKEGETVRVDDIEGQILKVSKI